ncbi:cell division protein FtsZ [Methylocella silvestris BL2]|uniref:Cell division protein FtsZ n=1 Tax=Methylocella silvestris (strain DSM 15510 / CIP 108128 / LMG 27833 / NCIMB 13906 / BL2) TaxID=395965 RepID=B8ETN2_METSB|nr:cell division protein FtsZ [Methylocella silvestris]ACK52384.1 cell division protein FtsZ [Methylocella silvestris BL2]
MTINLKAPELRELKPRIMVCGVGGAGGNAVNNMIVSGLIGVDFIVANTDAQALTSSRAERIIQMGLQVTEGLGAGSQPEVGRAAAEEAIEEIRDHLSGAHMCFVTAGMGGGTGTGAAPVIARAARDMGILTVGVVTKPFQFEGSRRMRLAESGINELQKAVDTLIIIPNQNLFRIATERTTFADAFAMADQVLYSGVACITDLMVKEGLINLDFADVRAIMREMGKAMMGTGEASGDRRAILAAEAAIANPLLDEVSMKGARGLLISITGGNDLTLYEVDEAAGRIRQEVDEDANIILGATFDSSLDGIVRVSVVATGIDQPAGVYELNAAENRITEVANRLRAQTAARPIETAPAPVFEHAAAPEVYAPPVREAYEERIPQPQTRPQYAAAPQGVYIEEAQAPQHRYAEPAKPQARIDDHFDPGPFIPAAPESPVVRPQRMPQIDDLPLPAQNQLRAQRGEAPAQQHPHPEAKRRSLLERLASFGAGRQDEGPGVAISPEQRQQAPQLRLPQPRPQGPNPVQAEYGKRPQQPAPQQRPPQPDPRAAYQTRVSEEDQLEIPAFLRRQSS